MTREEWLEAGLLTFVLATVGGLGILLAGRGQERIRHSRRNALPAPEPGDVSHRSHQNIAGSAAR